MAKYGKWIGGGLGWVLGGPIGGILGFAFGAMFDSMQSGKYEYRGVRTQPGDFSVSLLVLSAAVMKADQKVLKSELNYVKQFLYAQFGTQQSQQMLLMLKDLLKQDIQIKDVSLQIKHYMDYSSRLQLIHYLFGIALSDGRSHQDEVNMIDLISGYLGIRISDYQSIKAMFIKDQESAYKILEIGPDASDDEVKKAYRRMAAKYHPDKVVHLGPDVQKAAKEKFQKLNQAYSQIKKQRGMK
jgi:DnaJ like chaperone protein